MTFYPLRDLKKATCLFQHPARAAKHGLGKIKKANLDWGSPFS